jgi:hypothetical protein
MHNLQIHSTDYNTLQLVNTQEKENLKPLNYYTKSPKIQIIYYNQITQHKLTLNSVKARTFMAIFKHTIQTAEIHTTTKCR